MIGGSNTKPQDLLSIQRVTLKRGMAEWQNGGKYPQTLRRGMAENTPKHYNAERPKIPPNTTTQNGRKYPQTLKRGTAENTPKH